LSRIWSFAALDMHTPPGFAERFQACRDVDAVAKDIVAVDDDVADVDPHPEHDLPFRSDARVAPDHAALDLDRAGDRIHDAGEFHQHPIAGGLDDAAVVLGNAAVDQFAAVRF
jgi:hypothetical protein